MLILKRKEDAPVFTDSTGCPRPDMIMGLLAPVEDKKNKWLELHIAYFHDLQSYIDGKDFLPGMRNVTLRFTADHKIAAEYDTEGKLVKLGWPTYSELKQACYVDDEGELVTIANDVKDWFISQGFALDFENKPFGQNWEWVY